MSDNEVVNEEVGWEVDVGKQFGNAVRVTFEIAFMEGCRDAEKLTLGNGDGNRLFFKGPLFVAVIRRTMASPKYKPADPCEIIKSQRVTLKPIAAARALGYLLGFGAVRLENDKCILVQEVLNHIENIY